MPALTKYHAKRHFGVTKEPRGRLGKRGNAFVIQKHDATRLHYDLRLQLDGAMKSWAVTRGPSLVPGEKRLAVQVEDHPIEYNKFEGTIPKGQYGGGTVMVWDRGRWQPENDPHKGLAKGHLAFQLDGQKLHGGWHLVRMRRRPNEKRDNWLLIKQHDEGARKESDKDILEEKPLSVKTGRTLDEIAQHKRKLKTKSKRKATKKGAQAPGQAMRRAGGKRKIKRGKKRPAALQLMRQSPTLRRPKSTGLSHARRAALPAFVEPCLASLVDKAPDGSRWIHELKFDGYRIQARLEHGKVKLMTRKGLDWTDKFRTVAEAVARLPADTALMDGELVSEDAEGISRFSLLQQDLSEGRHDRMVFYVFDLLHCDGADLKPLPLAKRKAALAKLLARTRGAVRFSESLTERGPVLLKEACKMGLEGIISKLADAPYRSGRAHDWIKSKCSNRQEFVVAGFAPSTADAHAIGALVLGVYDRAKLKYAGRVGTGYTHDVARNLYHMLKARARKDSPLQPVPKEERGRRGPIWVEPKMVVEVDFRGWTHGDRVRQASFQGVREDKPAKSVVREST